MDKLIKELEELLANPGRGVIFSRRLNALVQRAADLDKEPKPECDHIVGKIDFSEDHLYEMSWTELKEFFLERDITWHLTDMENIRLKWMGSIASDFVPFDHCHLCGEKIDLQAVIESTKKLNLKKDE